MMFEKRSQTRRAGLMQIRFTEEERRELKRMARSRSSRKNLITASDLIRSLLRREWFRWKQESKPEARP